MVSETKASAVELTDCVDSSGGVLSLKKLSHFDFVYFIASFSFPALLAIWLFLDHTWPYWDGASHVMDSIKYRDLLSHPSIFKMHWWSVFLTVNYCYPPALHFTNGLLKLLLGTGLFAEKLMAVVYCLVLSVSVYHISWRLFQSRLSAALSSLTINCFPVVMQFSHSTYLDYAYFSLVCLCVMTLLWWRDQVNWSRTIVLGLILGLGVSSKQVASYFLIFPCLLLLIEFLIARDFRSVRLLIFAGLVASFFLSVWVIPNFEAVVAFTHRPCPFANNPSLFDVLRVNTLGYLSQLPQAVSPLLLTLFIGSLVFGQVTFKNLKLSVFSVVVASSAGVIFLLAIAYNNPEIRYIFPVFLLLALVTGNFLKSLVSSRFVLLQILGASCCVAIAFQYFYYSFTPYPVSLSPLLSNIGEALSGKPNEKFSYIPDKHPTPGGDVWGQEWVLDKIRQSDGSNPSYMLVVPNEPRFNVHTFNLLARLDGHKVVATTSRTWTLNGDDIKFEESKLRYFQWFLILEQGSPRKYQEHFAQEKPRDLASFAALKLQEAAIKRRSKLFACKILDDGAKICLYHQN